MTTTDGYLTTDDGVRLYFQRIGDAKRVLLVPNGPPLLDHLRPLAATRTVVAFDARNRGRSDRVTSSERLARSLDFEVEDVDAVRRHFGVNDLDLLGHSYNGIVVILYAMRFAPHTGRIVQISPSGPDGAVSYPLENPADAAVLEAILGRLAAFGKDAPSDPEERCRRFWEVLRPLYVVDPADVGRLDAFERCHLESERQAFEFLSTWLMPQFRSLALDSAALAAVHAPVLTIHGRRDRSAPYAAGREWAHRLPNARLLSVDNAGHMPWIEAPDPVLGAMQTFLQGEWPATTVQVNGG